MKSKYHVVRLNVLALASVAGASIAGPAAAQNAPPAAESKTAVGLEEVVVTARKRAETSLETPVVLTAFTGEQLSRLGVTNITDVAKLTPQLVIAPTTGPFGGNLTLRGVASPTSNAAAEPAVTINIDGVPISYGGVVRMGTIDVGQIEVLKGPQALFFGKNSSGGIVSIRSAEPTDTFKAQTSAGYEFKAHQTDLDGFVSGPITETLNARLAGRFSRQQGYFTNVAPGATFGHAPGTDEEGVRLSLNWMPTERLTFKLRGTYDNVEETGSYSWSQKFRCPQGFSAGPGAVTGTDDCKANNHVVFAPFPADAARALSGNSAFDSDRNYLEVRQRLLVGDLSYDLSDHFTLNSVTGYYDLHQTALDSQTSGARFFIGGVSEVEKDSLSQELRLSYSNPDAPLDFMIGGFYQDDDFSLVEQQVINTAVGLRLLTPNWHFPVESKSYSAFAQLGWDLTQQLNLSVGARYSRDRKYQDIVTPPGVPNKFVVRRRAWSDWSPEATLSYQPNEDLNIFASFKEGYKAGAYQIGGTAFTTSALNPAVTAINNSYEPETVRGGEVGVKARLFDRQLRLNVAVYSYLYEDLQVSRLDPATVTLQILNASSARVEGVEADFSFNPQALAGLTVNGSAGYNTSEYDSSFFAPCYVGQTIADGCTLDGPDPGVVPDQQQFKGRTLPRAPKFSASLGMAYEMPIGDTLKTAFNVNGIYTSRSYVAQELSPAELVRRRVLLDGGVTIGSQSGSYDVAFIGRNLTNKRYPFSGFQSPGTGGGTGTTAGTLADAEGPISRGRELWLRLTVRPSEF